MNLNESLLILNISKDELVGLNEEILKKKYHNKALKIHPDKGGNNDEFIKLNNANENLKKVIKNKDKIINEKSNGIENYINIDMILSYCNVFLTTVQNIKRTNEVITLNATIDDILFNNVYKLLFNKQVYFVPLWHDEVTFEVNDIDLIVNINPIFPDNLYIDINRNIHVKIELKYNDLIGKKLYKINIVENIEYDIDVETLFIKDYQMYILKGKGISKINNSNIYDIEKRNDIVVHLYLS